MIRQFFRLYFGEDIHVNGYVFSDVIYSTHLKYEDDGWIVKYRFQDGHNLVRANDLSERGIMNDRTDNEKIDACARIAYETLRTYSPAFDGHGSWTCALHEFQQWFLDYAKKIIEGNIPETPSSARLWADPRVTILIAGNIRGMAAALGMKVTYPAVEAHGNRSAYPKRTIDWSVYDK